MISWSDYKQGALSHPVAHYLTHPARLCAGARSNPQRNHGRNGVLVERIKTHYLKIAVSNDRL